MSDLDHYRHCTRFLNPSFNERFDSIRLKDFVPNSRIHENCWHSEGNGQSDFGFLLMDTTIRSSS